MDALIARYNERLAAGDPLAEWEQLVAAMDTAGMRFGERRICNVLRPLLLTRDEFERARRASAAFFAAIARLYDWLMEDEALRARMGLSEDEAAALAIDPGYPTPDGVGRLDGFLDTAGRLRFVEYNADSPGGLGFGHVLGDIFMALPTMRSLAEERPVEPLRALDDLHAVLLDHYRRWGGRERHPTIAIVDWEGVGTAPEFVLCQRHFETRGNPTLITHPAALELRGDRLFDGRSGRAIDVVYKRVLIGELLERQGLENILTETLRRRAAPVINSYRMQLLFKKALFALLSELADHPRFAPAEGAAIRTHLPWTRIVAGERVDYHGDAVDLLDLIAGRRERFVLKPNSEYGGSGVVLGWECDDATWTAALERALASSTPFVVQERIPLAAEPFPLIRDSVLRFEPRYVDLDPYTFGRDRVRGAGARLGSGGLLNVTAGGGSAVPVILVD